ncbi:hypothetical protein AAVH_38787, partial [Aphelenchoides avenae]
VFLTARLTRFGFPTPECLAGLPQSVIIVFLLGYFAYFEYLAHTIIAWNRFTVIRFPTQHQFVRAYVACKPSYPYLLDLVNGEATDAMDSYVRIPSSCGVPAVLWSAKSDSYSRRGICASQHYSMGDD